MSMHNASLSTSTSTILPLAYHHVCEQCVNTCVNIHLPIVSLNAIVPCMSMHNASLSTSTSTTLPLAYYHVSPSVNNVWTLVWNCIHLPCNCFFKCYCTMHVHAQCKSIYIYIYYTATCISPCVTICEHCCVNMHLQSVSWNTYDPLCLSIIYVYVHIHVLHYHLQITMCEQCVNTTLWTSICQLFH